MEKKIFDEICTHLKDAAVVTWFTNVMDSPKVETIEWFEDQVEIMLSKDVKTYPMKFPAVLVQFENTSYDNTNPNKQDGKGKVVLHIVQERIGQDGNKDASTFTDFDTTIGYKDLFIDLFNGFKLPCAARLTLSGSKVDHRNRPLRDDEVTFDWAYMRKKPSGVPGF